MNEQFGQAIIRSILTIIKKTLFRLIFWNVYVQCTPIGDWRPLETDYQVPIEILREKKQLQFIPFEYQTGHQQRTKKTREIIVIFSGNLQRVVCPNKMQLKPHYSRIQRLEIITTMTMTKMDKFLLERNLWSEDKHIKAKIREIFFKKIDIFANNIMNSIKLMATWLLYTCSSTDKIKISMKPAKHPQSVTLLGITHVLFLFSF